MPKGHPKSKANELDCDGKLVEPNKLTDKDYRRALQLGISIMLRSGELNHADVKPD